MTSFKKSKLYIIGNGFDMAHGMPTSYSHFRDWLQQNGRPDVIYEMQSAFPAHQDDDFLLWSDFEKALGLFDIEKILNWGWEDLYLTEYSIGGQVFGQPDLFLNTRLSDILCEAFTKWVRSISLPTSANIFTLPRDAYYLTFNYTDTLEASYSIPDNNILHIHGRASQNDELIVGHNREITIVKYWDDSLDMRENNERMQRLVDMNEMRKPYYQIMNRNNDFFQNLNFIKDVYVIGHSCSEIDYPYFQKINDSIDTSALWHFAPHTENDRQRIIQLLSLINVNIHQTTGIHL